MSAREFTGHDAISFVNGFIAKNEKYKDIILSILNRNLEIRADDKVINRIIPGTIPTFEIALAAKFEPKLVDFKNETWYASRKLDGCRCITIIDAKGNVSCWSRGGKQFEPLGLVEAEIKSLNLKNTVLDGEICLINDDGTDSFQGLMSEIRKEDHTIKNPRYKMFDCLEYADFLAGTSKSILSERLNGLTLILKGKKFKTLEMLKQEIVKTEKDFARWAKEVTDNKWEGFMVRNDVGYEGKRSKNLLKVKTFSDAEYVVKDVEFDNHRIIKGGKEIVERMLANVIIEHKGCPVSVGSGFSHEQRRHYFAHPKQLIGKTITVKYIEETIDKNGKFSLRFPTLVYIYEKGRNT